MSQVVAITKNAVSQHGDDMDVHGPLRPGDEVAGRFSVRRAEVRQSRSGTRYLVAVLMVQGYSMPAIMFDYPAGEPAPRAGTTVEVRGLVQENQGTSRLKLRSLRQVNNHGNEGSPAPRTAGEAYGALVTSIADSAVREAVKRVLRTGSLYRAFKTAQIVEESAGSVVESSAIDRAIALAGVVDALSGQGGQHDRDLLVAAALLYYVGAGDAGCYFAADGAHPLVPVPIQSAFLIRDAHSVLGSKSQHPTGRSLARIAQLVAGSWSLVSSGNVAQAQGEASVLAAAVRAVQSTAGSSATHSHGRMSAGQPASVSHAQRAAVVPLQGMRCVG